MKQKTFHEFTDEELYWFYVHFLNSWNWESQEDMEKYLAAEKELESRGEELKEYIIYLKSVI